MKYAFRTRCSPGASFLSREDRVEIVREIASAVEKMPAARGKDSVAFFEDKDRGLKIVVRFEAQEIHIMTIQEAQQAGLPEKPDHTRPFPN